MSGPESSFSSTDHLGHEAIAAYVDSELAPTATLRAETHLAACEECRVEVVRQRQASRRLRDSGELHIPTDLRAKLASLGAGGVGDGPDARNLARRAPDSLTASLESMWRNIRKMKKK